MNPTLKTLVKLSSKVTIYIPSTVDVDKAADTKKWNDDAAALLSKLFGGATGTPCAGFWMSEKSGLVRENVNLVYAYCTEKQLNENIDDVIQFCVDMKNALLQEAISLEVNGSLCLI